MYVPERWAHVTKITSFTAVRVRVELRTYKCIIIRQGVQFCSLCATLRTTDTRAARDGVGERHALRGQAASASVHRERLESPDAPYS